MNKKFKVGHFYAYMGNPESVIYECESSSNDYAIMRQIHHKNGEYYYTFEHNCNFHGMYKEMIRTPKGWKRRFPND